MFYVLLKTVHLLSVIVWLGGMFFTLFCLRQAVALLPPAQRLPVLQVALGRFFQAVTLSAALLLLTGGAMMGRVAQTTHQTGAAFNMPLEWLVMTALGLVMVLVFGHVRLRLFKQLKGAVAASDWPAGAAAAAAIRGWVAVNLMIGTVIVVVVFAGTMS